MALVINPYLEVTDVSKTFKTGRSDYTAVRDIGLSVADGEFVSIIGHSGCGKSTVLSMVAGLIQPTTGMLAIAGKPITQPGSDRALVFQNHALLPWLSVYDNVYEAADAAFPDKTKSEKAEQAESALQMVGLWDHRLKRPHQISGGMKQRTAIARAFVVQPRMLLLDEPFGALDALTKSSLHEELVTLWSADEQAKTVIMVTHDIDEAIFLSDRVVVMSNGPAATIAEIADVPLVRPRSKRALAYMPEYAEVKDHLLYLLTNTPEKSRDLPAQEFTQTGEGRVVMTTFMQI